MNLETSRDLTVVLKTFSPSVWFSVLAALASVPFLIVGIAQVEFFVYRAGDEWRHPTKAIFYVCGTLLSEGITKTVQTKGVWSIRFSSSSIAP